MEAQRSLRAADPGRGLAQAESRVEPMGGHSSSGRGSIRAAGSWRKAVASDLCHSGPNRAVEAGGQAGQSRLALSSPGQPFPHLETGSLHPDLCPFAMGPWGTTGPFWLSSWPSSSCACFNHSFDLWFSGIYDSRACQGAGEPAWQGDTWLRKRRTGSRSCTVSLYRWGAPTVSTPHHTAAVSVEGWKEGQGVTCWPLRPSGPLSPPPAPRPASV